MLKDNIKDRKLSAELEPAQTWLTTGSRGEESKELGTTGPQLGQLISTCAKVSKTRLEPQRGARREAWPGFRMIYIGKRPDQTIQKK